MGKFRTFLLAAAITVGGGISPITSAAHAHGAISEEIFYYSEFAQQNLVGHYITYCDGHYGGGGQITEWNAYYSYGC
jgi:hypothetical protein